MIQIVKIILLGFSSVSLDIVIVILAIIIKVLTKIIKTVGVVTHPKFPVTISNVYVMVNKLARD